VYDVHTGGLYKRLRRELNVSTDANIAMTRNGSYVTTGHHGWEVSSGDRVRTSPVQSGGEVAVTPDGWLMAIANEHEKNLKVLGMLRGKVVRTFPCGVRVRPSFSDDGALLAYAPDPNTVCVSSVPSGKVVRSWPLSAEGLVLSADGAFVLAGTPDGVLRLDVGSGATLRSFPRRCGPMLALTPDARVLVCGCTPGGTPVAEGQVAIGAPELERPALTFCSGPALTSVAVSADARTVATGDVDGHLRIWHVDWALEAATPAPWSDDALALARAFVASHVPIADDNLSRRGAPAWDDRELDRFMRLLGWSGLGWLQRAGVTQRLAHLAHMTS
jgi:hypothetical protein